VYNTSSTTTALSHPVGLMKVDTYTYQKRKKKKKKKKKNYMRLDIIH
tara:strand:+ start:256 stop:396 length:141 start_codon:yes stop_codon:yes gene_type:complete